MSNEHSIRNCIIRSHKITGQLLTCKELLEIEPTARKIFLEDYHLFNHITFLYDLINNVTVAVNLTSQKTTNFSGMLVENTFIKEINNKDIYLTPFYMCQTDMLSQLMLGTSNFNKFSNTLQNDYVNPFNLVSIVSEAVNISLTKQNCSFIIENNMYVYKEQNIFTTIIEEYKNKKMLENNNVINEINEFHKLRDEGSINFIWYNCINKLNIK